MSAASAPLKLASLSITDPRRATTHGEASNLRLPPTATVSTLLSALPSTPGGATAETITVNGGASLPVRGAVRAVRLADLNASLDALWRGVAGAAAGASAGVDVRFERGLRGGAGENVWREVRVDGDVLPLGQGDRLRVCVRARGVVAVRVGFRGRDCRTGERWAAGVLGSGGYWVCGGSSRELIVDAVGGDGEEMVADGIGGGTAAGNVTMVVEVYPVRDFEVWVPRRRLMVPGTALHRTPRMVGVEAGDTIVFFSAALGRVARELTLAELGVCARDEVVVGVSRQCAVLVVDGRGVVRELKVDVELDCVADLRRRAVKGGCAADAEGGTFVFGGRALQEGEVLAECGVYERCEIYLVGGAGGGRWRGGLGEDAGVEEAEDMGVDRFCVGTMESASVDVVNCMQFMQRTGRSMAKSPITRSVYEVAGALWREEYGADAAAVREMATTLAAKGADGAGVHGEFASHCSYCGQKADSVVPLAPCEDSVCAACEKGLQLVEETPPGGLDMYKCPVCSAHVNKALKQVRFGDGEDSDDGSSTGTVLVVSSGSAEVDKKAGKQRRTKQARKNKEKVIKSGWFR